MKRYTGEVRCSGSAGALLLGLREPFDSALTITLKCPGTGSRQWIAKEPKQRKLWAVWQDYFATGEGRTLMVRIGYAENEQDDLVGFGREFDPYFTAVPHIADIRSSISGRRRIAADQPGCLSTGDRPNAVRRFVNWATEKLLLGEGLVIGGIDYRCSSRTRSCAPRGPFRLVAYPSQGHEMLFDAPTTGLSMMCINGLMHAIAGALDHAILLIHTVPRPDLARPAAALAEAQSQDCQAG